MQILVIGIGNILLSDEGVGVHLLQYLQHQFPTLNNVLYVDAGTVGLPLVVYLEHAAAMLVLDAAELGAEPGTVQIFTGKAMDSFSNKPGRSVHEVSLGDLLAIGQLTATLPQRRALIAIQPQTVGWGLNLSIPVAQALPSASLMAYELLSQWC